MNEKYDVIIIGTWSAGLPAWMYASRYNLKNLIIWKMPGWALSTSHLVENYPWYLWNPWREIMNKFREQAENSGSEILFWEVKEIKKITENNFEIELTNEKKYFSKKVIISTWNNYKKLNIESEIKFHWKWVSYCATCDWMFFKWKDVAIIWGGNTAITEALYLSEICNKVYIIHRSDIFRAENSWIKKAKSKNNIELITNEELIEIKWNQLIEGIKLKSWRNIKVNWVFIAIWSKPNTEIIDNLNPNKDEEGCLIVDNRQETSIKWIYAAWDITTNSNKFKQTIMSAAEGCLAANSVHEDLIK